jgi:hypothetical protein
MQRGISDSGSLPGKKSPYPFFRQILSAALNPINMTSSILIYLKAPCRPVEYRFSNLSIYCTTEASFSLKVKS